MRRGQIVFPERLELSHHCLICNDRL
jgi:hypothetical protein